ncbi:MAG TPA: hypothetical protein PKD03_12900 [Ignavibacteriaceae bacterium]|nr:hypothetical protein [Ignavibacteriaceae bacterium]
MKNFPHQFNNLDKLFNSLQIIQELVSENLPITDTNFGERLTREGIYTFRDKDLSIDEYLMQESLKPASNRGYLTVSRDIRRLFELLKLINIDVDKNATLTSYGNELLTLANDDDKILLWKRLFWNLELEGSDGEISHPYRILIWLVNKFPGIETSNLMLALEAENDSEEEYSRISALVGVIFDDIVSSIGTTTSMARNAVKILPAIAEQLGDIVRNNNSAFPVKETTITEEDISSTIINPKIFTQRTITPYWEASVDSIAKKPEFNQISDVNIDLTNAIKIRQQRLEEHQNIVRTLASIHADLNYDLFEGKFDCLCIKSNACLLYEVKTLSSTLSDLETQTVKAVGQLKYYNFSIVKKKMEYDSVKEFLVFSREPSLDIIEFCENIGIQVIWFQDDSFFYFHNNTKTSFNPDDWI